MNKRKLLYLAAPYTAPDPVENTHWVGKVGMYVFEAGEFLPFVPHLNLSWHFIVPRSPQFWYELDFEYLKHCDSIVRLPGFSPGADLEMEFAEREGMEIVPFENLPPKAQQLWNDWINRGV